MKLFSILVSTLIMSSTAFGSLLIQCELDGNLNVQNTYTLNVSQSNNNQSIALFDITAAEDKGSHFANACKKMIGTTVAFNVKDRSTFTKQKTAKVSYRFISNFGPKGVYSSTTYKILNEKTYQAASLVENINGFINGMPRIRHDKRLDIVRLPLIGLNLTATVSSKGCTDASHFDAKLVDGDNGLQELSIQRIKVDFCEVTEHDIQVKLRVENFKHINKRELIYDGQTLPVTVLTEV